jgi:hypothetical protein
MTGPWTLAAGTPGAGVGERLALPRVHGGVAMNPRMMHVTIDPTTVSPAKALAVAARSSPLLVVTCRAFDDLSAELGDGDAAVRHLLRVATNTGRPVAVNLEGDDGDSTTCFLAPRGWSSERLAGWAAGHHEAIEAMFGTATPVPPEDL